MNGITMNTLLFHLSIFRLFSRNVNCIPPDEKLNVLPANTNRADKQPATRIRPYVNSAESDHQFMTPSNRNSGPIQSNWRNTQGFPKRTDGYRGFPGSTDYRARYPNEGANFHPAPMNPTSSYSPYSPPSELGMVHGNVAHHDVHLVNLPVIKYHPHWLYIPRVGNMMRPEAMPNSHMRPNIARPSGLSSNARPFVSGRSSNFQSRVSEKPSPSGGGESMNQRGISIGTSKDFLPQKPSMPKGTPIDRNYDHDNAKKDTKQVMLQTIASHSASFPKTISDDENASKKLQSVSKMTEASNSKSKIVENSAVTPHPNNRFKAGLDETLELSPQIQQIKGATNLKKDTESVAKVNDTNKKLLVNTKDNYENKQKTLKTNDNDQNKKNLIAANDDKNQENLVRKNDQVSKIVSDEEGVTGQNNNQENLTKVLETENSKVISNFQKNQNKELNKTFLELFEPLPNINDKKNKYLRGSDVIQKISSGEKDVQPSLGINHHPENKQPINRNLRSKEKYLLNYTKDRHSENKQLVNKYAPLRSNVDLNNFDKKAHIKNIKTENLKKTRGKFEQSESVTESTPTDEKEKRVHGKGPNEAEERRNKIQAIEEKEKRIKEELKMIEKQIKVVVGKQKSFEDEIKHIGGMFPKPNLKQQLSGSSNIPSFSTNNQEGTPENAKENRELIDLSQQTQHVMDHSSEPSKAGPTISVQESSRDTERNSSNKVKRKKKKQQKNNTTSQQKNQDDNSKMDETVTSDDLDLTLEEVPRSETEDKGLTSEVSKDRLNRSIFKKMNELKMEEYRRRHELLGELISKAFNPANPKKPTEIYPSLIKSKFSYVQNEDDGKEFAKEIGLIVEKENNIIFDPNTLYSNFEKLVREHLKVEDDEEYLSIAEMDFGLFKKLQLTWYLNPALFVLIPSFGESQSSKIEIYRRIQTLINQLQEHTIVENWKIIKSNIIQNNFFTQFEAEWFEKEYMLNKMFPFFTDYTVVEFDQKPRSIVKNYLKKSAQLQYQFMGKYIANSRTLARYRASLLVDDIPSLWKSKTLENYYRYKGLNLNDAIYASEMLGLSLDQHYKLLGDNRRILEFDQVDLNKMVCPKRTDPVFVPWHESSNRKFLVEFFGAMYDLKLEIKCKEFNKEKSRVEQISKIKKPKNVLELKSFLESRQGDMIRFGDLGLGIDILKLIMILKDNQVNNKGGKKLNWDFIDSYLSKKLNQSQRDYIELWFEQNTTT